MTFTAIVSTHANKPGLDSILTQLASQTHPPTETITLYSGYKPHELDDLASRFNDTRWIRTYAMGDWGHAKRARGLREATSHYLGFFNDDDTYHPTYLEQMLQAAVNQQADVVYCNWNENPDARFELYRSTAGNFIAKRTLAQAVGWHGRHYEADGHFIERLARHTKRITHLQELLYWHNEGPQASDGDTTSNL